MATERETAEVEVLVAVEREWEGSASAAGLLRKIGVAAGGDWWEAA